MIVLYFVSGLGPTVSEMDVSKEKVFPKTSFSMLVPAVVDHIKTLPGNISLYLKIKKIKVEYIPSLFLVYYKNLLDTNICIAKIIS